MFFIKVIFKIFIYPVFANFIYQLIISLLGIVKLKDKNKYINTKDNVTLKRFAVIIPAHNEEKVIAKIITNLKRINYPKELYDIFVIADNCTDRTADVAREFGANTYERLNIKLRGKGYAIEWMVNIILKMDKKYDAITFLDPDNLVTGNYLFEMNKKISNGYKVVQAYVDSKNSLDSWIAATYSISYLIFNRNFQLSRSNIGKSVQLCSTGFCVTLDIFKHIKWSSTCLAGVLEFTCKLILKNEKICWAQNIVVYEERPLTLKQSIIQRKQWMQGFAEVRSKYFIKLLKNFIQNRDFNSLDCAIYTIQPIIWLINFIVVLVFFTSNILIVKEMPINISIEFTINNIIVIILATIQFVYFPLILIIERKLKLKILMSYILSPIYYITWIYTIIHSGVFINAKSKNNVNSEKVKFDDLDFVYENLELDTSLGTSPINIRKFNFGYSKYNSKDENTEYIGYKKKKLKDNRFKYEKKKFSFKNQEENNKEIKYFTKIDFPSECQLHCRHELKIQLTKDIPHWSSVVKELILNFKSNIKEINLDIKISAPKFALQQSTKNIKVKVGENSEEIIFELFPVSLGEQIIEIEIYNKGSRIVYVVIETKVNELFKDSKTKINELEDIGNKLTQAVIYSKSQRTIHVHYHEKDKIISYTIYSDNANEFGEWKINLSDRMDSLASISKELISFINETVNIGNPKEVELDSIYFSLKSKGRYLLKNLLPPKMIEITKNWEEGSNFTISTNEQWIPWELFYDGDFFWGQKFIFGRSPRSDNRRNIKSNRAESIGKINVEKITNVVGGNLIKSSHTAARDLFNFARDIEVDIFDQRTISELNQILPETDLLHITCHGSADPPILYITADRKSCFNLDLSTVSNMSFKSGCMVFANACYSNSPSLMFGTLSSFGWEFYKNGADVFIGTFAEIPDKYAIDFAKSIYEIIFSNKNNMTLGEAIFSAKKEARKNRNIYWLLYTIYGNTNIILSKSHR